MRLRQLEYLVAVAELRSIARAAESVNISQPTLSQQIKALEDDLGVVLFERSRLGALPTPIGRDLIERARSILRDTRELRQVARQAGAGMVGTIRLGTTPTLGPYLLSPVVPELHQAMPDLRIHVREGIPSHQIEELVRGHLDLHLGPLPINDSAVQIEPLFREHLALVVAKDHPLAARTRVDPGDLAGMPLLSIDPRHHYHRQVVQIARMYRMRLAADYEGTSLDSLHQMAASGLGAAVLPALYIASDVGGLSGLRVLDIADWRAYRSIALAWRRSSTLGTPFATMGRLISRAAHAILMNDLRSPEQAGRA